MLPYPSTRCDDDDDDDDDHKEEEENYDDGEDIDLKNLCQVHLYWWKFPFQDI